MTTTFAITTSAPDTAAYFTTANTSLSFKAEIVEINGKELLVEVTDSGDSLISKGTQAYISIDLEDSYAVGDNVQITFDGVVQETYPCRLPNVLSAVKL